MTENTDVLLGTLKGHLEAILDRMDRADESRAGVHRRLDDFANRLIRVETEVVSVKHNQASMQAVTDDVVKLRNQAQGAGTLGHWLIRLGLGVIWLAGVLASAYTWLTGRPPP